MFVKEDLVTPNLKRTLALSFVLTAFWITTGIVWAQLPVSYAGIWIGIDESLVYTMLEKNAWPYAMERSQTVRIHLNNEYVEAFTISFVGRKVQRIQIIYKPGIENYGSIRFPEMEALLVKKYGKYKDRNNWSTTNDRGETISQVRWVWESANSRLEFRGRSSDTFDRQEYPITESHQYSCDILTKNVEIFLERSQKEITNLERLP
jgi:hypothetical protein